MERRRFIEVIAGGLLAVPPAASGQQTGKVYRVGYLSPGSSSDPARQRRFEAFRQGLRELGYVEGQNVAIEPRWADGNYDRYPALAAELVRLKVDVIVAVGGGASQVVQQATRTIPIVMSVVIDPLGIGLVTSLARPGGNVTGLSLMVPDLVGKQFEVLKEVVPKVSREVAARALGVQLQRLEARGPQEIDSAFAAMTRERAGALVVLGDGILMSQRRQIAELAAKGHLPAVYALRERADAGGLMVYGANPLDLERRAATFVDKILKGAKLADLPIEQPRTFELVINLKTARALRLTIPPSLLRRADEVIQ